MLNFQTGETLYGLTSNGKYKVWTILVEKSTIKIVHGYEDGVLSTFERTVSGKNIGKANETTAQQQAELEATSRYNKQIDKGYRKSKSELEFLPVRPMLAQSYTENQHRVKDGTIYVVQPKLNGVRCIVQRHGNKLMFTSRAGKDYTPIIGKHTELVKELLCVMKEGSIWDGEIYCHGVPLQTITSWIKKWQPNTKRLQFWVYDTISSKLQFERLMDYVKPLEQHKFLKFIVACPIDYADNNLKIKQLQNEYIQAGYEGLMLRNYSAKYTQGVRSYSLLKFKDFKDSEFKIVDAMPDYNGCVIWLCQHNDDTFKVVPLGSFQEKQQMWIDSAKYIGKLLTVRYSDVSKKGIPIGNPVGIAVRDYE